MHTEIYDKAYRGILNLYFCIDVLKFAYNIAL